MTQSSPKIPMTSGTTMLVQFEYMTEAVSSYHNAYSNGSYNEYMADYAGENYARAYKRIQIILAFLHGEQPEDEDLTIEYSSDSNE